MGWQSSDNSPAQATLTTNSSGQINENAWQSLYHTESLPFNPPETDKIAIKVINHFGDEVLNVRKIV